MVSDTQILYCPRSNISNTISPLSFKCAQNFNNAIQIQTDKNNGEAKAYPTITGRLPASQTNVQVICFSNVTELCPIVSLLSYKRNNKIKAN
jgi:hypothetical protein